MKSSLGHHGFFQIQLMGLSKELLVIDGNVNYIHPFCTRPIPQSKEDIFTVFCTLCLYASISLISPSICTLFWCINNVLGVLNCISFLPVLFRLLDRLRFIFSLFISFQVSSFLQYVHVMMVFNQKFSFVLDFG